MINLLDALRDYLKDEYSDFLFECETYEKDSSDYPTYDDWLNESIQVLFHNKVMDAHGFSNQSLQECIDSFGSLVLYKYPMLYSNDYIEWQPFTLGTILKTKSIYSFNINNYILK